MISESMQAMDSVTLMELQRLITEWFALKCPQTAGQAGMQWMMTFSLNAFYQRNGQQIMGVREHDTIGAQTPRDIEPVPIKKQPRVIIDDNQASRAEKTRKRKHALATMPEVEDSPQTADDAFRFRERNKLRGQA